MTTKITFVGDLKKHKSQEDHDKTNNDRLSIKTEK